MLVRRFVVLTVVFLIVAEAPRSKTAAETDCASCHPEYGRKLLNSIMHTGDLNGRRVTDCLDCHLPADDQTGQECQISIVVPIEKCFDCHFDPRQLPLSAIGTVNTHYDGPRHRESGGLLCQDCHTTTEMHGADTESGAESLVLLACEDCHGTIEALPRSEDGMVLTAGGEPYGNVFVRGDTIVLKSATGQEFIVPILHRIAADDTWKNATARQAMYEVDAHRENLDCIACHADWASPCIGCHAEDGGSR